MYYLFVFDKINFNIKKIVITEKIYKLCFVASSAHENVKWYQLALYEANVLTIYDLSSIMTNYLISNHKFNIMIYIFTL